MNSLIQIKTRVDERTVAMRAVAGRPSSPPLVLMHGAGGSSRHFRHLLALLDPAIRAAAPDFPDHQQSEGPALPTTNDMVAWLDRLRDAMRIDRWVVGGHSMGGRVAMQYALEYPQRTIGLIVIASSARMRIAQATLSLIEEHFELFPEAVRLTSFGSATSDAAKDDVIGTTGADCSRETLLSDLRAATAVNVYREVHRITAPALIISGSEDRLTPPLFQRELVEAMPNAQFKTITGCGHYPHVEFPQPVAAAISDFIARSTAQK